jgi:alpha-L-fucosidase
MTAQIKRYYDFLLFILLILSIINIPGICQNIQNAPEGNYILLKPGDTPGQIIKKAANITPSKLQYEWQKSEFNAFVHFGINTFDKVEWGQDNIDISKFNPKEINVQQWVKTFKDAGMKILMLTVKHHDGFCLWPTKFTALNISNTPFQNGKGDIVRDISNACREAGLKFGIYLSPWDMHEKTYGTPAYNDFFKNLLTELITNYGEITEVWFDGANGEGPNGKKQIYDWNSYYQLIRRLQPNAAIAIMGPDVRWVGTESGYGRETEWSVLPGLAMDQKEIAEHSQQQSLDSAFIPRDLMDEDLGSMEKIEKASSLIWYPAEVDVSIRPRWFYNEEDDELVKSPYKLIDIYFNSVGLNDVLLLNVPPGTNGLINENDIKSLQGMRCILDETFKVNLVNNAIARASDEVKGHEAKYILDNDLDTYWTTKKDIRNASIEIKLKKQQKFSVAMLQENILAGQRIEKFHLECWNGKKWNTFAEGTTIGYKRLLRFPPITTDKVKLVIDKSRTNPTLASFGLYLAPPEVVFEPFNESFADSTSITISSDIKNAKIYYTFDGTVPSENSLLYKGQVYLNKTTKVLAIAVADDGKKSLPVKADYNKALYRIEYKNGYDNKYPGSGLYTLVDGVKGSLNFNDGKWQGFHGSDLDVIIDLKKVTKIDSISIDFLRDINSYIFLPKSVQFSVSDDRKVFTPLKDINNDDIDSRDYKAVAKEFTIAPQNISARYIHIKAENIGVCPQWHKGSGDKAWIFADEITVN